MLSIQKKIGIIGYGALGKYIENSLIEEYTKELIDIYYFDDFLHHNRDKKVFRFSDFDKNEFKDLAFYVGLGYNHLSLRKEVSEQIHKNHFQLPSIIHKTAYINSTAKIADGVVIYPLCNVDQMVSIGSGVILNNSTIVSHNSIIDEYSYIAPGVTVSGNVKVGKFCFIGAASVLSNNISVGDNVKIGIGSNITKNIQSDVSVIGNPFKILNKNFKLS